MSYKYGDVIEYQGSKAIVIEERANLLIVEFVGTEAAPTGKRFKSLSLNSPEIRKIASPGTLDGKNLIRRR